MTTVRMGGTVMPSSFVDLFVSEVLGHRVPIAYFSRAWGNKVAYIPYIPFKGLRITYGTLFPPPQSLLSRSKIALVSLPKLIRSGGPWRPPRRWKGRGG